MLHVDDCLYHSVYFRIVLIATLLVWRQIIFFISHTTVPLFCNDLKSPPSSPGLSWPFAIFEKAFDRITASLISRVREEQNSMRELARLGWSHEASIILHTNYYTRPLTHTSHKNYTPPPPPHSPFQRQRWPVLACIAYAGDQGT